MARILRNKGFFSNESRRGFDSLHPLHFSYPILYQYFTALQVFNSAETGYITGDISVYIIGVLRFAMMLFTLDWGLRF